MIRVILVDDDVMAIKLIAEVIPWEEMDCKVVGLFSNSLKAISFIKQNKVDIVITDIAMPGVNGIGITKMCYNDYPTIKVILLSAFRNFDYAQNAIRYRNVIDYVTKPVDCSLLYKLINNTVTTIKNERSAEKIWSSTEKYDDRLFFFSNLLCGNIYDKNKIGEQFKTLEINASLMHSKCTLVHFHIHDFLEYIEQTWKHSAFQLYYAVNNVVPFETTECYISICSYAYGNITWMILHKQNDENNDLEQSVIDKFTASLIEKLKNIFKMNVTRTSYRTYNSVMDMLGKQDDDPTEVCEENNTIATALKYMEDNYFNNITLSEVAEQVFMCPVYFSAFFRKQTGKNFISKLTDIRLEHAVWMLKNTEEPINDIGRKIGYNHMGNFYDKFKRKYGQTPAEYRKNSTHY